MIHLHREVLKVCRSSWRPFLAFEVLFFGVSAVGVLIAHFNPGLHQSYLSSLRVSIFNGETASLLRHSLLDRNVPIVIAEIFVHNTLACAGLMLLPSLVIPFSGAIVTANIFLVDGICFGPELALKPSALLVHILEGQAYVLAATAMYLHAIRFLFPKRFGLTSHFQGYLSGLKAAGLLALLIPFVLLLAACYEAIVMDRLSLSPFPPVTSAASETGVDGTSVELRFSRSRVYYDSTQTSSGDAKVVGASLEDVGYFAPSRRSQRDSSYRIEIEIAQAFWEDPEVVRRLHIAIRNLKKAYVHRDFEIVAFSHDTLGNRVERSFKLSP
jgi:hypothetical protein